VVGIVEDVSFDTVKVRGLSGVIKGGAEAGEVTVSASEDVAAAGVASIVEASDTIANATDERPLAAAGEV